MSIDITSRANITRQTVERIYRRANELQQRQVAHMSEKGMRVARAQHPVLLRTLEACAEQMEKIEENQRGRTQRMARDNNRARSQETSIFREAFRLADEGKPFEVYAFIYGAVAEYAGIIERASL